MIVVNARFLTQQTTGVQRYAAEIARRLKELVPDTVFVSPHDTFHNELADELNAERIGRFTGHLWEQFSLPRFLRRQRVRPLLANLANTAPLYYRPKIVTIHDVAFMENPEWFSRRFARFYRYVIPRIAKSADKVVTVSEFSKREIIRLLHVPHEKIIVINDAVCDCFLQPDSSSRHNEYGDYILTVSSLNPRKNFKRMLQAFEELNRHDIKLVIVGSENSHLASGEIITLLQSRDRVIFTGFIPNKELAALYSGAKVFLYLSLYEGFGIPPLEAMACGCPCLVSNTSSLSEVCGDAALYCDPYDVTDIAAKMKSLLDDEDLRSQLIARGSARVQEFSWDKSAQALLDVIKSV
ncbi:MAG: glycosyltransferase family 4 protein [Candidatus Zixiibacteriota bacterium]|nr:MAG: glycosyltransferase family 4 protein [candidate division Zixibacteria bacterium]